MNKLNCLGLAVIGAATVAGYQAPTLFPKSTEAPAPAVFEQPDQPRDLETLLTLIESPACRQMVERAREFAKMFPPQDQGEIIARIEEVQLGTLKAAYGNSELPEEVGEMQSHLHDAVYRQIHSLKVPNASAIFTKTQNAVGDLSQSCAKDIAESQAGKIVASAK